MNIEQDDITFPSGDNMSCPAIIFRPKRGHSSPRYGVILAHAWWGINAEVIQHAREYAEMGPYTVVLPDFYRGKVATNREDAGHYMADLDWSGALKDLEGATNFLLKEEHCKKVGVVGFCMGGALSFLCAGQNISGISVAVSFYGIPSKDLTDMTKTRIPIQGNFAINDKVAGLSSPADFMSLYAAFTEVNKPHLELNIYPTDHGFMHPTYHTYDKNQTKVALGRMKTFLSAHLS